jgi:hypothetical protein
MSAAALPAGTEQFTLVAALVERRDDPAASGLGVSTVLLQHESKLLPNELRARESAFAHSQAEQPVVFRVQCDRRRLLSR